MKVKRPLTPAQRAHKNRRQRREDAARRRAFVAAGLRCDGLPRAKRKPCGCLAGSCLQCRRPDSKGYWSPAEVAAMRADYESGMSASAVERKHGVAEKGLRSVFQRRGIPWRKWNQRQAHHANGQFVRDTPKTPAEITALIEAAPRLTIPAPLKNEWRDHWSLAKRKQFVDRLRASLQRRGHTFAPTKPHSKNVQPFDYFTPAARAIVKVANFGRTSQTKAIQMRPASQGMIYRGELWFWTHDGYQRQLFGHESEGRGGHRPFLHRHIYELHHGPIPPKHTVIFRDDNKNNFDPKNLALRSMADCARLNQVFRRLARDPKNPDLLAKAQQVKDALMHGKLLRSRRRTTALLAQFNQGTGSRLLSQLKAAR